MALDITYRTGNNITITATETSLAVNDGSTTLQDMTDDGVYTLYLDTANMVKGDEYLLKVYEKAQASATKRVYLQRRLRHTEPPLMIPHLMLGIGWDITLQRISVTSRAFYWSIRRAS